MLSASCHLLLSAMQKVQHCGVIIIFSIHGQCLDQHGHRLGQLLVGTTIMNRAEQCLLLVVVFRQQEGIGSREEGAFVDAVLFAVGFHLSLVYHHLPR